MHRSSKGTFLCACLGTLCLAGLICPSAVLAAGPDSPTLSPTTGKIDLTINVNIATTGIPSNATISCEVMSTVNDANGLFFEFFTVQGTRNGNTAVCQPWFNYSWLLLNPGSDTVSIDYAVSATSTSANGLPYRESSLPVATIPVPANGAITRITANATL